MIEQEFTGREMCYNAVTAIERKPEVEEILTKIIRESKSGKFRITLLDEEFPVLKDTAFRRDFIDYLVAKGFEGSDDPQHGKMYVTWIVKL
jgi:hypothetical protein